MFPVRESLLFVLQLYMTYILLQLQNKTNAIYNVIYIYMTASVILWSEFLATDPEARVRFPALPEKKSSGSGTGSSQPREYN
jgi:hypothetical protein